MKRGDPATDVRARIMRLAAEDLPATAIAERVGCSMTYAWRVIREWRDRRAAEVAQEGATAP